MLKHILRGSLLVSFQDREHEGGDTRSQGGIKDNDSKIKIQDHIMHMISQRNSQEQGSKFQERIKEEIYVCQPPGFEDPDYPDKVYKVEKALYGLHQALRAWYETLAKYLLDNGFHRGKIDQTLFIKRQKKDILLVQVYVDDIIFGSTKKELCTEFEKLMHDKFQMSSMGESTFFLGLQFKYTDVKPADTPMDKENTLLKDSDGDDVDVHLYRSMIASLMYLTSARPDIMFDVYTCAKFQVNPKVSHLHAVKRIFRYLKGQPKLGLWYPRDSSFDLVAYTDSNYAGASLDRKSRSGGCQFLGCRLISWQCKKQTVVAASTTKAEYVAAASSCGQARPKRLSNLHNEPPLGEGKVTVLKNELNSTKDVYKKALITLTKRVKKLKNKLKHKRRRAVVESSKDEEARLDKEDSPK
nr:putative ribonuclease H-like domain-containing protein [Tanacetum cinerariifolium]